MGVDEVLRHIGFAEGWLHRARGDYRRGQVVRGELTLVLAEAEIRHAWERSRTLPREKLQPRGIHSVLAVTAFAGALVLLAALAYPGSPTKSLGDFAGVDGAQAAPSVVSPPSRPIVSFSQPIGAQLMEVDLPLPVSAQKAGGAGSTIAEDKGRRSPGPVASGSLGNRTTRQRKVSQTSGPSPEAPRDPAPGQANPQGSGFPSQTGGLAGAITAPPQSSLKPRPVVTPEDLVDLVLAAERTLRGTP